MSQVVTKRNEPVQAEQSVCEADVQRVHRGSQSSHMCKESLGYSPLGHYRVQVSRPLLNHPAAQIQRLVATLMI